MWKCENVEMKGRFRMTILFVSGKSAFSDKTFPKLQSR